MIEPGVVATVVDGLRHERAEHLVGIGTPELVPVRHQRLADLDACECDCVLTDGHHRGGSGHRRGRDDGVVEVVGDQTEGVRETRGRRRVGPSEGPVEQRHGSDREVELRAGPVRAGPRGRRSPVSTGQGHGDRVVVDPQRHPARIGVAFELGDGPATDRVVSAGQAVRNVCVQALHAGPGAADASVRPGADVVGVDHRVTLGGVPFVHTGDLVGVDLGFGLSNASCGLEPADSGHQIGADEVEARRHRCAVVEERGVAHHDGVTAVVADDDVERALGLTAEQLRDASPVIHQRRRRRSTSNSTISAMTAGATRLTIELPPTSMRSMGSVAGPSILRTCGVGGVAAAPSDAASFSGRRGVGFSGRVGCLGEWSALPCGWRPETLFVDHLVEVVGELCHEFRADVAHDAPTELCHLARDVQVRRHVDTCAGR